MLFPSLNQCILTSVLLLPIVSAQAGVSEGPLHYYHPSEWVAKMIAMLPNPPCHGSENPFCIPKSQRTASDIWDMLTHTDVARAISPSYRSLLSVRLGTQTTKAIVITKNGVDWADFVEETEVELAGGTRAFCRGALGKRGVYCWDVEIRQDPNLFQSLYGRKKDTTTADSGWKTNKMRIFLWVGPAIYS